MFSHYVQTDEAKTTGIFSQLIVVNMPNIVLLMCSSFTDFLLKVFTKLLQVRPCPLLSIFSTVRYLLILLPRDSV